MAQKDEIKWNKKYQEKPTLLEIKEPSFKLIKAIENIKGKKALDIASGAGRNSIYLASKGFDVEALDISSVALEALNSKGIKNIKCKLVDLDTYEIEKNYYDLIVMTNFLDRNIILKLKEALKKEGVLFIETYTEDEINEKPTSNSGFLLKKEELLTFFDNSFEVLEYDEFLNGAEELYKMKKQSIIVRKY
ncbi:MAG: methyltransferase domain-containing protein [Aliarcobacter sp.]|nr:methyltransferase domain-containing protein [Aliarcobacter sp.]